MRGIILSKYEQERIPIQLLKEGATETKGKDARKNSFAAVKLITQVVRSSLVQEVWTKCWWAPLAM